MWTSLRVGMSVYTVVQIIKDTETDYLSAMAHSVKGWGIPHHAAYL